MRVKVPKGNKKFSGTIQHLLDWGLAQLAFLGEEEAKSSTEKLLEEATGFERAWLYANTHDSPSKIVAQRFKRWIGLRRKRQPVAYVLKKAYFWNEVLEVGTGCLIPRPETEILVEEFIRESGYKKTDTFSFLDLGCGSGAIGIALLGEYPKANAFFSDVSKKALAITRKNLVRYSLETRAQLVHSDLFKVFNQSRKKFHAIVSNPPYVSKPEWRALEKEVLREPKLALLGGQDGLEFYRRILEEAPRFLEKNGLLMFEMGEGQAQEISRIARKKFAIIKIFKDYRGIDRVFFSRMNG